VPLSESDGRPAWARRIREERAARGWSQARLVTALRAHSDTELPSESSLLRRVKSWEAGDHVPDGFYRPLIAKTFGTVTTAIWPEPSQHGSDITLFAATGMDTLEIISRIRSSSIDRTTLDGLRITVDCVIRAAETGEAQVPGTRVAVLLAAQRAMAWARIGDRRQAQAALDPGRALLERMPHPDNLDHLFAVDPATWDYYAMDAYRVLGANHPDSTENRLAKAYAEDAIRRGTSYDGTEREPMRIAQAHVTLGVVSARQGNLEEAIFHGRNALHRKRQSLPTLLTVHSELEAVIQQFGASDAATEYFDELMALKQQASSATV
jgi:hypothetical protein